MSIDYTIIAGGWGPVPITCSGDPPVLSCCDVYGNGGGDWVDCIADQYGVRGNICEDPLFCNPAEGDFTIEDCSPCTQYSPPNPECGRIGACPVGCGGSPVIRDTWGGIKSLFRR